MTMYRLITNLRTLLPPVRSVFLHNGCSLHVPQLYDTQVRNFRKSYGQFLRVMKARRKAAGPDRVRKRTEWDNWNYNAELYAFCKRLHENISEETLRTAFVHKSYILQEEQKRKALELSVDEVHLSLSSNVDLITSGNEIMNNYLPKYLRHCFQYLPEEGICALHSYLVSDKVLSHVSANIGTSDLIYCVEYPVTEATLASTLKAIIGGIATDENVAKAENFVLDFICTQLIAKDIFEIWNLENPIDVLNSILKKHSKSVCESRLIFESGRNTLESVYLVGLYTDKECIGKGPGETVNIAEETAAYDALRKLFHINEYEKPLPLGKKARELKLNTNEHPNIESFKNVSIV